MDGMAKVYLIRHCESEGNACRRTQAQVDALVTTKGMAQTEALRRRFEPIAVDAVYSSETYRSIATARPIAEDHGAPLHVRISLREITTGVWEDMAWGNIAREYPEAHRIWEQRPWENITPGAGTFAQSAERAIYCIRRMAREVGDQGSAVAVSHSVIIKSALCAILGLPLSHVAEIGHSENTAVSLLNVDKDGNISVEYMNDASHLSPELRRAWSGVAGEDINMAIYPLELPGQESALLELAEKDAAQRGEAFSREACLQKAGALLEKSPRSIAIAYLREKPAGFIEMGEISGGRGRIERMYVLPQLQGRGYCEQLFGYAACELRYADIFRLEMRKNTSPEEARVMARFGFEDCPRRPEIAELNLACPPCPYPILS